MDLVQFSILLLYKVIIENLIYNYRTIHFNQCYFMKTPFNTLTFCFQINIPLGIFTISSYEICHLLIAH